jgi:hypothetical protein
MALTSGTPLGGIVSGIPSGRMDFFGPSYDVKIVPRASSSGDVSIADAISVDSSQSFGGLGAILTSYVTSVTITLQGGGTEGCEVTFNPPYEVAMEIFNKTQVLNHGNLMTIKLGYPETNDVTKQFVFTINNPSVQLGIPNTQITVVGMPLGEGMGRTVAAYTWRFEDFNPDYALGVINTIAKKHGMTVVTGDEGEGLTDQSRDKFPVNLRNGSLWRQSIDQIEDDHSFLRKLCHNSCCDFRIEGSNIRVLDHIETVLTPPVCMFRFYGQVDSANAIFPMETFDTDASQLWPGEVTDSETNGRIDIDKQESQPIPIDPQTEVDCHAALGKAKASHLSKLTKEAARAMQLDPDTSPSNDFSLSALRSLASASFATRLLSPISSYSVKHRDTGRRWIKPTGDVFPISELARSARANIRTINATLTTPGNPHLYPFQNVLVEGVGRYSGVYRIDKLEHKFDSGGFKTTLTLTSGSYGSDQLESNKFLVLLGSGTKLDDTKYKNRVNSALVSVKLTDSLTIKPQQIERKRRFSRYD